jgi:hypothetical protein
MNELQFGDKVRQVLNRGAEPDAHALQRLRAAREQALARKRAERAPALAWAGNIGDSRRRTIDFWLRLALPAALLVIGLAGVYSWQQKQKLADVAELDAQLLSDDLPIDAYLDKGFELWLSKRGTR